jgi:RNA polymerase sigma factor for flagellar operon FliA
MYDSAHDRQEALVMSHMVMVKRVAVHLKARIPPFMELDELVQVGMLGLIEAARGFDPTLGHPFENYALRRVRGAMLDEVRRLSSQTRSAVSFHRDENQAMHELAAQLGRTPTQAEVAQFMGREIEDFQRDRGTAVRGEMVSMEDAEQEVMNVADETSSQPEAQVEKAQLLSALTNAIQGLPEREQLIINLYYVEELNLKEIGEILSVSESRVSQLLSAIAKKLRTGIGFSISH